MIVSPVRVNGPRDWWEMAPMQGFTARCEAEHNAMIARTPKHIALYVDAQTYMHVHGQRMYHGGMTIRES